VRSFLAEGVDRLDTLIAHLDRVGWPDDDPHKGEREAFAEGVFWATSSTSDYIGDELRAELNRRYPQ